MRIVIDLDGTICYIKQPNQEYSDVQPIPGAVKKIKALRASGHYIIIQTARNMQTRSGNLGLVNKHIGKTTLDWLEKHGVEYDEIYFGKPNAHLYIDDRALRFSSWDDITDKLVTDLGNER